MNTLNTVGKFRNSETSSSSPAGRLRGAKIAVIEGDGIGPEVTKQSIRVLNAIAETFHHEFN